MIYIYSPFYNEKIITKVRLGTDSLWSDELHICESDYTFKKKYKGYNFSEEFINNKFVHYHPEKMKFKFIPNNKFGKLLLSMNRFGNDRYRNTLASPAWYNEGYQRNRVNSYIFPKDDDYVVLSDIDEILIPECVGELLDAAKTYGIATCKLHFTMFKFNLFVSEWGGPKGYSYRLFVMTGKYFNNMKISSDELRKQGERGELLSQVHLVDKFCGFHHSWLGDASFVMDKLNAYAHNTEEHRGSSMEWIDECIRSGKNVVDGAQLFYDPNIRLLDAVENLRDKYGDFFYKE